MVFSSSRRIGFMLRDDMWLVAIHIQHPEKTHITFDGRASHQFGVLQVTVSNRLKRTGRRLQTLV
jgi:hypothetical protein